MGYDNLDDTLMGIAVIVQLYIVPYAAYFLGIYIRRRCFPTPDAPPLVILMLLGVPVCLLAVTPILQAARLTLVEFGYAYLVTIGMVMEQGMVVHETVVSRLQHAMPFGAKNEAHFQGA